MVSPTIAEVKSEVSAPSGLAHTWRFWPATGRLYRVRSRLYRTSAACPVSDDTYECLVFDAEGTAAHFKAVDGKHLAELDAPTAAVLDEIAAKYRPTRRILREAGRERQVA